MAKVISPSAEGNIGGLFTIDANGNAHQITPPIVRTTAEQIRYRNLMRALNSVLVHFGDATDDDVATATNSASWWSSETFARWALFHGHAIDQDLNQFGRGNRCSEN